MFWHLSIRGQNGYPDWVPAEVNWVFRANFIRENLPICTVSNNGGCGRVSISLINPVWMLRLELMDPELFSAISKSV